MTERFGLVVIVIRDDAQIAVATVRKIYGQVASLVVEIRPLAAAAAALGRMGTPLGESEEAGLNIEHAEPIASA